MMNVPRRHDAIGLYRLSDFYLFYSFPNFSNMFFISFTIRTTQFQSISHDFSNASLNSTPCYHAKLMKKSIEILSGLWLFEMTSVEILPVSVSTDPSMDLSSSLPFPEGSWVIVSSIVAHVTNRQM